MLSTRPLDPDSGSQCTHHYALQMAVAAKVSGETNEMFQNELMLILHHSPSLLQPPAGQSGECIGCQSPDPVVESEAQVMSMSHWPQQHLPVTSELSIRFSYWQSGVPSGAAQRLRCEGCRGGHSGRIEKNQKRIVLDKTALV